MFLSRAKVACPFIYTSKKLLQNKRYSNHCFQHLISYVITGSNDSYFKLLKRTLSSLGSKLLFENPQIQKQHCSRGVQPAAPRPHVSKMVMNVTQHKIVNLLKILWDFFVWLHVTMYLMCGPRQLFFLRGPKTPKGWTPL